MEQRGVNRDIARLMGISYWLQTRLRFKLVEIYQTRLYCYEVFVVVVYARCKDNGLPE